MAKRSDYCTSEGAWVPSVTDVLQAHKSDYKSAVIEAAAIDGEAVHAAICAALRGVETDLESAGNEVRSRYLAFRRWRCTRLVVHEASEYRMGGIGPAETAYGGTLDAVLGLRQGRVIVDFKPARRDYLHFAQLGAYGALYEAHHPDRRIDAGLILHLDPKTSRATEDWLTRADLEECAWWFRDLRSSYQHRQNLKARFAERRKAA